MSESNVAQDELKAFVRRIESVEDEINALNSDKSEIYKEAKSSGFDTKQLRKVIQKRRLPQSEREEQDTVFDLYWDAVHASEKSPAHARVENIEEFRAKTTVAALRSNADLAIVEAANITPKSNLQNVQNAQTEPQPSQPAGSDLTSLAPHEGQVAPNPVAKADDDVNAGGVDSPSVSSDARSGKTAEAESVSRVDGGRTPSATSEHMDVTAGETAPKYAEPGVVVWEHTPPEPVRRHPYSAAFGDLGQDMVVIDDDIAGAKAEPIVRIGNEILDGWARYNVARGMIGGSGMSTEYPVVQYAGTDPLIDCIKWNVAGRVLSPKDKQTIVSRLSAIEPKRKADIIKAVAELAI